MKWDKTFRGGPLDGHPIRYEDQDREIVAFEFGPGRRAIYDNNGFGFDFDCIESLSEFWQHIIEIDATLMEYIEKRVNLEGK